MRARSSDFGNTGWSGLTYKEGNMNSLPLCNSNGHWVNKSVAIAVNTNYNRGSDNKRRGVAIHEFGHALGLAHNNNTFGAFPGGGGTPDFEAIMYPTDYRFAGNCAVFSPTVDDRQGVNALY